MNDYIAFYDNMLYKSTNNNSITESFNNIVLVISIWKW